MEEYHLLASSRSASTRSQVQYAAPPLPVYPDTLSTSMREGNQLPFKDSRCSHRYYAIIGLDWKSRVLGWSWGCWAQVLETL